LLKKNNHLLGALLVFIGAICFSLKAIIIKTAYTYPVDPLSLLTLRMTFSLPFFVGILIFYNKGKPKQLFSTPDSIKIVLLGLLGYYAASIFDFIGLKYVSASMERLILFVYPTLVILLSALIYKKKIPLTGYISLVLTYIGIVIVFQGSLNVNQIDLTKGAVCIFISAFTYAGYLVGSGNLIPRLGSVRFTSYAMIVSSLAVIVQYLIFSTSSIFNLPANVYWYGFAIAIVSTVIPVFLVSEGINLIGAGKASIIASVGPISTIMLDHFVLGQPVSIQQIAGTILVLAGVLLVGVKKEKEALV
jgi:drug/metabolite transporter (DMT)-like permease